MGLQAVRSVVSKALTDAEYRSLLVDSPYDALEGYDLEPEEQGALVAASEEDLSRLGVPEEEAQRFSELFRISRGGGG